jgi:capsular polysaccharide biosynthesis protein
VNPFESVGGALRRRHRLVWLPALAAIAVAGLLVAVLPPTYEATALLGLDEQQEAGLGFDLALQADQYLTQRYVAMATSPPVLDRVCRQTGPGCDAGALTRQVTAQATRAAGVIAVTVRARSAVQAARMATVVAQQVVAQNQAQAAATATPTRTYLRSQLDQLEKQQEAIQARLAAAQSSGQPPLLAQLTMTQQQYTATYGRVQDLDVQQARLSSALLVRQTAPVPSRPADPDLVRYVLVAAAAGLTGGFLLALLADLLDRRVRDAGDLAAATGADVVLDADPRSAATECCALLLHAGGGGGAPEDVLVVAASREDEAGAVGDDLARAASEMGRPMTVSVAAAPTVDPRTLLRARTASAAIVVATRGRTAGADARRTAHLLRRAGADVRAAVLLPG